MRISDWSSDVCSSDLRHARFPVDPRAARCRAADGLRLSRAARRRTSLARGRGARSGARAHLRSRQESLSPVSQRLNAAALLSLPAEVTRPAYDLASIKTGGVHHGIGDRKSVVSGKSVAVRVDIGGRGIIKKKKQTQ